MSNIVNPIFRQVVFEDSEKIFYKTENKDVFKVFYSGEDQVSFIRAKMTSMLFKMISDCGIKNHFLNEIGMREHEVCALDIMPFIFTLNAFANEKMAENFLLQKGMKLKNYLFEIFLSLKKERTLISKEHILNFDWANEKTYQEIEYSSKRIMDLMTGFFKGIGATIISVDMQFGKRYSKNGSDFEVFLADELSFKTIKLYIDDMFGASDEEVSFELGRRLGILQK